MDGLTIHDLYNFGCTLGFWFGWRVCCLIDCSYRLRFVIRKIPTILKFRALQCCDDLNGNAYQHLVRVGTKYWLHANHRISRQFEWCFVCCDSGGGLYLSISLCLCVCVCVCVFPLSLCVCLSVCLSACLSLSLSLSCPDLECDFVSFPGRVEPVVLVERGAGPRLPHIACAHGDASEKGTGHEGQSIIATTSGPLTRVTHMPLECLHNTPPLGHRARAWIRWCARSCGVHTTRCEALAARRSWRQG